MIAQSKKPAKPKRAGRRAWGVLVDTPKVTLGPMGVYCERKHRDHPETGAYRTMAFRTRREAREWCAANTYRRGSRSDGWYWSGRAVRIRIIVTLDEPRPRAVRRKA